MYGASKDRYLLDLKLRLILLGIAVNPLFFVNRLTINMPSRVNPKAIPFAIVAGAIGLGIYTAVTTDHDEVQ